MRLTAEAALAQLREGNARFIRGESRGTICTVGQSRADDAPGPIAVVVSCSDSRVPTEIIFDVAPGDIWVVRSAGHVLGDPNLASVRFGVQNWAIPLILVIGHDDCQAVEAAMSSDPPDWMRPVTDYIAKECAERAEDGRTRECETLRDAVEAHVAASVAALRTYLRILPAGTPQPAVVGGTYIVSTGEIQWLD